MSDVCGDNRFEIIEAYKKRLIEDTNIESRPDEMAVIDNILLRFWQMGWLSPKEPEIIHCKDCRYRELDDRYGFMCGLDTGDPYGLGRCADDENWYCADAERRRE